MIVNCLTDGDSVLTLLGIQTTVPHHTRVCNVPCLLRDQVRQSSHVHIVADRFPRNLERDQRLKFKSWEQCEMAIHERDSRLSFPSEVSFWQYLLRLMETIILLPALKARFYTFHNVLVLTLRTHQLLHPLSFPAFFIGLDQVVCPLIPRGPRRI